LRDYLKPYDFVEVHLVEMWELMLCVFIKREDYNHLHSRATDKIALGILNLVGNKGGVVIQFSLYDRLFSFINCHLTSGAKTAEQRVDMIAEIIKKIQPIVPPNKKIPTDACHDFNFILGDMNFRFNRTFSEHIDEVERSAELIPMYDQLFEVRTKEFKFPLYQELPIDFMPTYKR
jgi:hypothetical protein